MIYLGHPCLIHRVTDSEGVVWTPVYKNKIFAIDTEDNSVLRGTLLATELLHKKDICMLSYEVIDDTRILIRRNNDRFLYMAVVHIGQ